MINKWPGRLWQPTGRQIQTSSKGVGTHEGLWYFSTFHLPTAEQCSICCAPLLTAFHPVTHTGALCTPFHTRAVPQVSRPHPPPKNEKQECEVHRKHSSFRGLGLPGEVSRVPLLWCTTRFSHTLSHHSGHSCVHSYFLLSGASGCWEFNLQ